MIQDVLLYYFSGTGNTYRTATWFADAAHEKGMTARVIPLDGAHPANEISGEGQLVGLLCPTHAFTAPWTMILFALRLPRGRGARAFSLLTRGGMKIGQAYIPGLEGSGAYLLALILWLKGYKVVGATGLDLPATWTVVAPGYSKATAEAIQAHSRPKALSFIHTLLEGGTSFRSFVSLALGIALLPFSFLYLVMGRFFLAKLFYASPRCNGCGLCAQACPVQAIRMKGRKEPRPYWTFLCESCTRCMNYCPKQAVEASYPFGVIAFTMANIPVAIWLLDMMARWIVQAGDLKGSVIEMILQYPFKLLAIALAYGAFTLALRIPIFNRIFTLATPTHYYHRYTEPGTRLREIVKH